MTKKIGVEEESHDEILIFQLSRDDDEDIGSAIIHVSLSHIGGKFCFENLAIIITSLFFKKLSYTHAHSQTCSHKENKREEFSFID